MSAERKSFQTVDHLLEPVWEVINVAADFFLNMGPLESQEHTPRRIRQAAKLGAQSIRGAQRR